MEGLAFEVVEVDESVRCETGGGGDAGEEDHLLAGGPAGLEIFHVGVEYLCGLGVVVELQGEGVVVDSDDTPE